MTQAVTLANAASTGFFRNRLINGNMYISQRATSATVTAGTATPGAATGYPCVDRWFVYSTGANITAAQVSGSGNNRNLLQITGAASVTAVGIGQRIESVNSYDLAGQTCTLSVDISNSVLTTITWTVNYANTTDTFGTIGTPTKTQIATGTFSVSPALARYTATFDVPDAAKTGIEVLFTVGAQTSGTWAISNAQLELGSSASPYEERLYNFEFTMCQRYYERLDMPYIYMSAATNTGLYWSIPFKVTKRTSPSITTTAALQYYSGGAAVNYSPSVTATVFQLSLVATGLTNATGFPGQQNILLASAEIV